MDKVIEEYKKLKTSNNWGTYYIGQYYFSIKTNRLKEYFGIKGEDWELSKEIQIKLQYENLPAIFHEYIHYLHELSTTIGIVGLSLQLSNKSIFSHNFDSDLKSCINNGVTTSDHKDKLAKISVTQEILMGDGYDILSEGNGKRILSLSLINQKVYFPHINDLVERSLRFPVVHFEYYKGGNYYKSKFNLGKYFIYEGLAYELDREVDKMVYGKPTIDDNGDNTEYTVLRTIAKFVFPDIEKRVYLSLATLSLQEIECGKMFIDYLQIVKDDVSKGESQNSSLLKLKEKVSREFTFKRAAYFELQKETREIFVNRYQLSRAFNFLTMVMENLYDERIKNPTFEVDYVMDGHYQDLVGLAQICDHIFVFNDNEDYMRDFFGTSIDLEISNSLKVLLGYDHMYKAHNTINSTIAVEKNDTFKCPFYHCCNLELRTKHSSICLNKPWRIFEISANSDKQYCWYGQAVGEFKSQTKF